MVTRHDKGTEGELVAAEHLKQYGLKVVARNFRCPLGEIDLIARDGKTIVFVEVKSRSSIQYGLPQEAVSRSKQKRLILLARWYLKKHGLEQAPARFDVIAILWKDGEPELTWIVNAFEARG